MSLRIRKLKAADDLQAEALTHCHRVVKRMRANSEASTERLLVSLFLAMQSEHLSLQTSRAVLHQCSGGMTEMGDRVTNPNPTKPKKVPPAAAVLIARLRSVRSEGGDAVARRRCPGGAPIVLPYSPTRQRTVPSLSRSWHRDVNAEVAAARSSRFRCLEPAAARATISTRARA
ncbi:hypothetical protein THAOC_20960 [Thalassiosira oceanica]|uniref:Uncharacterized protein n=1 Tax=Thalassiosira oceanica TaxID=159749 RepID=K0SD53_THAOC|nr:hypothetical protein THAOC_20960 [Thalassiosira oceanica]|eukprot:EJK58881.1 hypothetical protein THAOC_20960 [Thalassiosira oceanica]